MIGYDSRKRPGSLPSAHQPFSSLTSATVYPPSTTTVPTSNSTASGSPRTASYSYGRHPRPPSPPSSTYTIFNPSLDDRAPPQPTADADPHFAYSTTLRRHTGDHHSVPIVEAVQTDGLNGFMNYFADFAKRITGGSGADDEESKLDAFELTRRQDRKDSPSSTYSSYTVEATLQHFRTTPSKGLSSPDISALRETHGYNEFSVAAPEPAYIKFLKTIYESPLILLLCASAAISAFVGNVDDAISITVAVLIVLTVGFVQERRSEERLQALNKLVPHHCHVIRDGHSRHILANELVPGDIVTLSTGDRVPADLRLIDTADLDVDESTMTGETEPKRKRVLEEDIIGGVALADRRCVAYMGTNIINGRGVGVVIATGLQTEFGAIFSMMQDVEEKRTPLQRSMDDLAQSLSFISFGVIGVICFIGIWQTRPWLEMFTIGVSLAVAAIPEGLPIVTTVTLALGVIRMSKRKAIVKKLHSVEALGSISVICSDKTGTLTKNEQTVTTAYVVDEMLSLEKAASISESPSPAMLKLFEVGALCNNSSTVRNEERKWLGQSTDVALLNVLDVLELPDPRPTFTRLAEKPFSSETKYMAVSGTRTVGSPLQQRETYYIKGSVEAVLSRCRAYYVSEDSTPTLDTQTRTLIANKAHNIATGGLRVLAMAYAPGSVASIEATSSNGTPSLIFVGFQAMLDPPRRGVADAVNDLQAAGVQVVMITGDAGETAVAIAQDLGIMSRARKRVLTGAQLDEMSTMQLRDAVGTVSVFARTTPRHKMKIVEAFQARGALVAMTGDGVNDAPALKMADIGVSMGRSGTDVAKEAADVILVDDNFSTILPAIEEGKSIFHNIQNFVSFQLSTAAAALSLITLSTAFGLSNPLNAMQILFINILMDGPPAQSLGVDPVDPSVMRQPPRRKGEPIITRRLLYRVLFSASIIVFGTAFVYAHALGDDTLSRRDQTLTFTTFVFLDLVSALQNRSLACPLAANGMLLITISVSIVSQLGLVYVPMLQNVFQTEALSAHDLGTVWALTLGSFALHEARRRWERKRENDAEWEGRMDILA